MVEATVAASSFENSPTLSSTGTLAGVSTASASCAYVASPTPSSKSFLAGLSTAPGSSVLPERGDNSEAFDELLSSDDEDFDNEAGSPKHLTGSEATYSGYYFQALRLPPNSSAALGGKKPSLLPRESASNSDGWHELSDRLALALQQVGSDDSSYGSVPSDDGSEQEEEVRDSAVGARDDGEFDDAVCDTTTTESLRGWEVVSLGLAAAFGEASREIAMEDSDSASELDFVGR